MVLLYFEKRLLNNDDQNINTICILCRYKNNKNNKINVVIAGMNGIHYLKYTNVLLNYI